MNKTSSHVALGLTLLTFFCILIILNIYTPLLIDDYQVQFKISLSPLQFTDEPIRSFHELFTNMWNHRYILNGRMSNNLVMLLLYTVGKNGFNILNSLVIILSLCSICKLSLGEVTYRDIITSCALAILFLPCIPDTVFWLAGSCNYVWVTPFICGVLFYLERYFNKQNLSSLQTAILLSCAFIASSMHEGSGVILCGMTMLSILYQYREKEPMKLLWWVLLVSIIGTSIPLSAPGIWHRADLNSRSSNIFIYILYSIPPFVTHCGLPLFFLLIYLYRKGFSSLLSPKGFYILSGLVCTFIFAVYSPSGRGCFYLALGILVFILPEIKTILNNKVYLSLALSVLIIVVSTALQFDKFKKFDQVIEEENKRAENEKIFSIDIPLNDFNLLYFKYGTSWREADFPQKQYSIIQGVPEHKFVLNTLNFDKDIYANFPDDKTNEPVVIKTDNICTIRLPRGEEPIEDSVSIGHCEKNSNMPICFLFRKYTLWDMFLVKRKADRVLSLYSIDYQNGFFYIILPEPACHYHELTCSVTLPDESIQELHIDLDKTYQKP